MGSQNISKWSNT